MFKTNVKQKRLLQNLTNATKEYWHWQNLWVFIDSEAEKGEFMQYRGPQAHFDPDKAKGDRFGMALIQLHNSFQKSSKIAWKRFEEAYGQCIKAGIPENIVDKYEARVEEWTKPIDLLWKSCFCIYHAMFLSPLQKNNCVTQSEIPTAWHPKKKLTF